MGPWVCRQENLSVYGLIRHRKESTTKTLNTLLDSQPRWLRPKNREEMDKRIIGLSQCKTQRTLRRNPSPTNGAVTGLENDTQTSIDIPPPEFSETPLQDLLDHYPLELTTPFLQPSSFTHILSQNSHNADVEYPFQDDSVLSSSISPELSHSVLPAKVTAERFLDIGEESLSIYSRTSSLKRRLSHYSAAYLKTIARLLKSHSISNSSAATSTVPAYSASIITEDQSTIREGTIRPSSDITVVSKCLGKSLILPSSLLLLDRYLRHQGLCITGMKSHDSKRCWCLEDADPELDLWVHETGLVKPLGTHDPPKILKHVYDLELHFRDVTGNTILHMLAARGAELAVMVDVLEQGVDGNAKNMAGQNFLHVLPRAVIRGLARNNSTLLWVLETLNRFNIRFHDCDLFGRSFFHLLTCQAKRNEHNLLGGVLSHLNVWLLPVRDAFGWVATNEPVDAKIFHVRSGLTIYAISQNQCQLHGSCFSISPGKCTYGGIPVQTKASYLDMEYSNTSEETVFEHARLLETARVALEEPKIEDKKGRNGLQCIAEASFTLGLDSETMPRVFSNKRKRGTSDPESGSASLHSRYDLVEEMVRNGVDVNNYDKNGNNVLMAFVSHLYDGEDDKTLTKIFHHLIHSGANIHRRNRQGETALHLAVRLGRKVATRVLLEHGANVHARTPEGKGVLALGEKYYFQARDDPPLYASIMACMALCFQYGAVPVPTLVQEWSVRDSGFISVGLPSGLRFSMA